MFSNKKIALLYFLACLISRIVFAIYYIEDIDSMRFAMAAQDFAVADLRPHFPGYPLYCFLLQVVYFCVGSLGASFAIMGGLSIFGISYFSERIGQLLNFERTEYISLLIFINPLLFLMSTRYMPDIMGLMLLVAGTYFFLQSIHENSLKCAVYGFLVLGLLGGVRLSYLPFFIPTIYFAWTHRNHLSHLVTAFTLGAIIWLIPFIYDTGWYQIIQTGLRHTDGHFTEWGGAIHATDLGFDVRLNRMVRSIWADGLGGWWQGRLWIAIITSFSFVGAWAFGLVKATKLKRMNPMIWLLISFTLVYAVWAYFFQNIAYKPRHIMPILIPLLLLTVYGALNLKRPPQYVLLGFLALPLIWTTGSLALEHLEPSAISQAKTTLGTKLQKDQVKIVANDLDKYYLSQHKQFMDAEIIGVSEKGHLREYLVNGDTLYSLSRLDEKVFGQPNGEEKFFHNPYVNRLWSTRFIYRYDP